LGHPLFRGPKFFSLTIWTSWVSKDADFKNINYISDKMHLKEVIAE
jgi:hypothetical protein